MNVFDIPHAFIHNSIEIALYSYRNGKTIDDNFSDLKNVYFVGATLCLDTRDKFNQTEVITLCVSDETFGLFSGGMRRLIPIKTMKVLEQLCLEVGIKHEPKYIYTLEEQHAIKLYNSGKIPYISTFIDEDTIILGYGGLEHYDFKYPLPKEYVLRKFGTNSWTKLNSIQ